MADMQCIQCHANGQVHNDAGTEIDEILPIDRASDFKDNSLIYVCPSCAASTLVVIVKKAPKPSKKEESPAE